MAAMGTPHEDPRLRWLERAGVALLLVFALVPRARDLGATLDRQLDGFQGGFFALCAVTYERDGLWKYGGYPSLNIVEPTDPEAYPYLYPNHPPTVPLLAWASLKVFGPEGWNEAWREARSPRDFETALRFPFFLAHVLGLLGLWWAVRQGASATLAMLALAFAAVLPASVLYAGLVNYENPCLAPLLFGLGFHVRFVRSGQRRELVRAAACFLLAGAVTYTPLFFLPGIALQTWRRRGLRGAALEGGVLGAVALLPVLVHGLWVRSVLPPVFSQSVFERAKTLLNPLLSGAAPFPEWCRRQWLHMAHYFTLPILLCAVAGLLWLAWRALQRAREGAEDDAPVSLAMPLALGGFLTFLGFYTHTFDGPTAESGQVTFLLNLVPACAVLAAVPLAALRRPLARLRAGFAPLVLLFALLGLPAMARAGAIRSAWRDPGPLDDPAATDGPRAALPITTGDEIAAVLPPGAIGLFPVDLGLSQPAVSFYAWRTLLGVNEALWEHRITLIEEVLHVPDAPRYILFPRDPPDSVRPFVERYRASLAAKFEPVAQTDRWEIWPPEP